ncbi:uncharacterized protein LOC135464228 [Liolophura sinensis]|uniref:uncharacterized protein LOC135464228 n=1 Tax=Liolophura sinensis TaxID=3198878 RepID=UPI00315963B1
MVLSNVLFLVFVFGGAWAFRKEEWLAELQDIFNRYGADVEKHEFNATSEFYTETAVVLPPDLHAIHGREEFPSYIGQHGESGDILTVIDILEYTQEFAVAWAELKELYDDGRILKGKYVCLLKKVDGKALVEMEIWNYNS